LAFGRSGGLFVAIFLPEERWAKRIFTSIPNAKPSESKNTNKTNKPVTAATVLSLILKPAF